MAVRDGRVVITPGAPKPYKVVLDHEPSGYSEHPVDTVAAGEALIRERMRLPPEQQVISPNWHI